MIKRVTLGEELVITVKNKIGLMAEISEMLANRGINIESALGYESGKTAKLMLVTTANIAIISDLKRKYKSVKETEVVMVELEDRPGAMKVVTTELKKAKIDIAYLYVTSPSRPGGSSQMVIQTSDNEKAMAFLSKYVTQPEI
jgi:hypothetical protein